MTAIHKIRLTTQDDGEVFFNCAENVNLIDGAEKAQITLPAICRGGNCGACHATCVEGNYEHDSFNRGALSDDARAHGGILMCRTYPRGPMTVAVDADLAHITHRTIVERACQVVSVEAMSDNVQRLKLQIIPDEFGDIGPLFEAGQFMELQIPGRDIYRAYSPANAPDPSGMLEFMIRMQPGGFFSGWLTHDAKPGDAIQVRGPEGTFVLQSGSDNPRRFVAGGTGIAPMLSMLRQMVATNEKNPSILYFGASHEDDLFALKEIDVLKEQLPGLQVRICLSRGSDSWQGFRGYATDAFRKELEQDLAQGVKPEVYLCGPPALVESAEETAAELGLPHELIFCERFLPN